MKFCAVVPARAMSKVITTAPASPVPANSRSLAVSSVSLNWGEFGLKKLRGCGSNVTASAGQPGSGQRPQLGGLVGEPELGGVRAEKAARVRLERHRQRRPAMIARHLQRRGNDRTVAEMDAVEIPHRYHRSLGDRGRGRGVAANRKARRPSRNSSKE